jgi:DNA repair exonuclease SbcCD nuclease subunit
MIKTVIHVSDIHIRLFKRHEEYMEQFEKFFEECRLHNPDRIVITGDVVHSKNTVTPELINMVRHFLEECTKISKTILILGNHDFLVNNLDRLDTLTPIVETMNNPNLLFYKHTGCYLDDNIVWCVYGHMEGSNRPEIEKAKEEYGDDKYYIGLYHDPLIGLKTDMGYEFEDGKDISIFDGLWVVMCGDIHKRQVLHRNNTPILQAGSLIQQDYGETVEGHGYIKWDIENRSFEGIDIESDYGFYTFEISSIDDIEEGSEKFKK